MTLDMKELFKLQTIIQVPACSVESDSATPRTVAPLYTTAPLSMGFCRQERGVGCHSLFQGIFLTQSGIIARISSLLASFNLHDRLEWTEGLVAVREPASGRAPGQ